MTHISKIPMKKEVADKILKNFLNTLFPLSRRGKKHILDLLTPTERIMLAKRLAIIALLARNHSYYQIMRTLKVSTSTIKRIDQSIQNGTFATLGSTLGGRASHTGQLSFSETLELLLAAGMPSIAGPRYQRRLNELRRKRRGL